MGSGLRAIRDYISVPGLSGQRRTGPNKKNPQYFRNPLLGAAYSLTIVNFVKRHASHMDFNFPKKIGTGIKNLIPHATPDCVNLIE